MGTGGFVSPPPGTAFSGADDRPAVGAQGPPGSVRGLDAGDAAGALMCINVHVLSDAMRMCCRKP